MVLGLLLWAGIVALATPAVAYRFDRRFDLASTAFEHAVSTVLATRVVGGNSLQRLENGVEFYPAMLAAIASSPDVKASGAGQWDLRFRALRLARMESTGGTLQVTEADPAFRAYVRDWIRERLGAAVSPPDDARKEH